MQVCLFEFDVCLYFVFLFEAQININIHIRTTIVKYQV